MADEDDIQFLAPAVASAQIAAEPQIVSLSVTGATSDRLGSFLDVVEHIAHAMNLNVILDVPGYTRAFYGWECDIWNG